MTPPSNDPDRDPTADAGEAPDDATERNTPADATESNPSADATDSNPSAVDTGDTPPDGRLPAILDRVRRRPLLAAVLALTALALVLRLVSLGSRAAHWDEARVAYWALYTHEQGSFAYRHIIHGPFVQHTSRWLFPLFGASDFTVRLPVAIVGGLLPLSALLFRERLRRIEVGVLAAFLAFNPVFLYYSRFMRSDVLVGAFMFTALGLGVRFLDTRRPRYLYGIAAFVTLAIASKENAILYLVTWGGALVLLADRALDSPGSDRSGVDRLRATVGRVRAVDYSAVGRRYLPHVVGSAALGFALFVFMFAPRGAGLAGMLYPPASPDASPGFWTAVTAPGQWPTVVGATVDQFVAEYGAWGASSTELTIDSYLTRVGGTLKGLGYAAAPLSLFAVAGFVRERYGAAEGRPLVMLLFFAGVASLVGYPAGLSIGGGWRWNNVHILLPLSVPAAVGVAMVGRWGYEAFADDDAISVALSALVVVVVAGLVVLNGANLVFLTPATGGDTTNILVQHGQPNDDLSTLEAQLDAAGDADADVLYYGNSSMRGSFVKRDPGGAGYNAYTNFRPICTDWSESLPIHWYLAQSGANASCETDRQGLQERLNVDPPAIIVTNAADDSVPADILDEQYEATTYNLRSKDTSLPKATVYVAE